MKERKKFKFDSDEKKSEYIKEIIYFFKKERGEEIGYLAAGEVLDFSLDLVGEDIYKKAIKDIKNMLKEKMEDIEIEMDFLTEK